MKAKRKAAHKTKSRAKSKLRMVPKASSAQKPLIKEELPPAPDLWGNSKPALQQYPDAEEADWSENEEGEKNPDDYQEWDKRDRRIA